MTIPSQTQENQAQVAETPKQNDKEYNFAQLRKQMEEEKQARIRLEQELEKAKKAPRQEDDDDDEPYVDKRKLSRTLSQLREEFEQKIDQKAEQKARQLVEEERRNGYLKQNSDFQQVLASENIQRFAEKHPQVAEAMLRMPDTFERQQLLYEQIKAMGAHKKEDSKIQETIDRNAKSPYYRPADAPPPYASTGDFSETGQKNAYQKMQQLLKNRKAV